MPTPVCYSLHRQSLFYSLSLSLSLSFKDTVSLSSTLSLSLSLFYELVWGLTAARLSVSALRASNKEVWSL